MDNDAPELIFHSRHGQNYRGCLPVAFLLSAFLVAGVLLLLDIRMPRAIQPIGEGTMCYRNDKLIHFQIRQRSPLPMSVPLYVDPALQESAAAVDHDGRVEAETMPAPPFNFLSVPPDSAVLNAESLLALPPESAPGAVDEAPAGESAAPQPGEEVQP